MGRRGGERRGGEGQRVTPTPTHCTPTRHTTRNTQGGIVSSAYQNLPTKGYLLTPVVQQRNLWILHPDSSNHSLYLMKLFSFSYLEGNFGGNQPPDGSISLSFSPPSSLHHHNNTQNATHRDTDTETKTDTKTKCNERFARQILSMMFG